MSFPLPYKYFHVLTPIGFFFTEASESRIHLQSSCPHRVSHPGIKKRQHRSSRNSSWDSSQLPSLIDSLREELADNQASFLSELTKISSRVAAMEGQSPLTPQTITHEQRLVTVSISEQSLHTRLPQAEQQSLLKDTRITADRAEPQAEEST